MSTPTQQAGGVTSQVNLYDSEIIKVEGVLDKLNARRTKTARMSYDAFSEEARNLFAGIGLVASVLWYEMGEEQPDGTLKKIEGALMPEIVIKARMDSKTFQFDHDKMAHEVQSDLLQLGTGGKLKITASEAREIIAGAKAHKHGKGCGH